MRLSLSAIVDCPSDVGGPVGPPSKRPIRPSSGSTQKQIFTTDLFYDSPGSEHCQEIFRAETRLIAVNIWGGLPA